MTSNWSDEYGVRSAKIISIMPDIPNYQRAILGPYSHGIEPRNEPYERKLVMSETQCEETKEVIQRYKERLERGGIKVTGLHVDVVPGADPAALERELNRVQDLFEVRATIDPLTLAWAKIARYEALLSEISALGKASVSEWAALSPDAHELKIKINRLTSMCTAEDISDDIKFARTLGRIPEEQYYGSEKDA